MWLISSQNIYMLSKTILTFSFLLLTTSIAKAEFTRAKCEHALFGSGEIQVNRQWDPVARICFVGIHPRNVENLKYRDYYFDNKGQFMVFNSFGEGSDQAMTGSRDFYVFPLVQDYPDFSIEPNGDVVVQMVSGHLFRISAKDYSIVSLTPGNISEKPVSPDNKGGVEFSLTSGFWFDAGFAKGASRFANPNFISTIKTSMTNLTCSVANRNFLDYSSDGNFNFKFESTALTDFLKKACPLLKFD
jgi:hypothetical protein